MSDFIKRHLGSDKVEQQEMLNAIGFDDMDTFIQDVVPADLFTRSKMLGVEGVSEHEAKNRLMELVKRNRAYQSFIGAGYYDTLTPAVIKRNVLENPGWYTAYTPYQAEISQGRLEALLNYQQMIIDLTGLPVANASLLDESTAAAEAMAMARRINTASENTFFVSRLVFPQTQSVLKTRAKYMGINLSVGEMEYFDPTSCYGILVQNPGLGGNMVDFTEQIAQWKVLNPKLVVVMAYDILAAVLFKSAGDMGADIAVGSTQRFGIPMGFGGPAAAFMSVKDEYKRSMPGRVIGVAEDKYGKKVLRMSLQTREQHIRREKANSNICTSQVLLANMAGMYAVYHGPKGLREIAERVCYLANVLAINLKDLGMHVITENIFDTVVFQVEDADEICRKLLRRGVAVAYMGNKVSVSVGESAKLNDIIHIIRIVCDSGAFMNVSKEDILAKLSPLFRTDAILTHKVFNSYHTETKMMRYLKKLENRDVSLVHSMIPLGSCTMKLNSAVSLEPLSWDVLANAHPFALPRANSGYLALIKAVKQQLRLITGFSEVCLQPNSGAQGEYAGLLAIRRFQASVGQSNRNICLIPASAHGTNPATAGMMGLKVVGVACDENGNVNVADLKAKAEEHRDDLSCLMITYPSTHGVFEGSIKEICKIIHLNGGQVYMDGANLNAMVGLVKPADLGADVSHMNLHKTFAIPHGGGGPGMGPIGVKSHLVEFLPDHPMVRDEDKEWYYSAVSAAPYGSASILAISWMYITMLGDEGLKQSTKLAILNANYLAKSLQKVGYKVLYTGQNGHIAHECIIDLREIKSTCGITETDFAKRLMDYGFHAPTVSFPVAGTLMIEPTESESKDEIDRFVTAMTLILKEVEEVMSGASDKSNNLLKNAPHTLADMMNWDKPYSIEAACFPASWLKDSKIFPSVNRIDDVAGDRNFMCSCFDFASNE